MVGEDDAALSPALSVVVVVEVDVVLVGELEFVFVIPDSAGGVAAGTEQTTEDETEVVLVEEVAGSTGGKNISKILSAFFSVIPGTREIICSIDEDLRLPNAKSFA